MTTSAGPSTGGLVLLGLLFVVVGGLGLVLEIRGVFPWDRMGRIGNGISAAVIAVAGVGMLIAACVRLV